QIDKSLDEASLSLRAGSMRTIYQHSAAAAAPGDFYPR
ncbi:hypothetical protein GBAG_1779, partial [Buttiauxella agrestis ATCC 33320]